MKKLLQDRSFNTIASQRPINSIGGSCYMGLDNFANLYQKAHSYVFEHYEDAVCALLDSPSLTLVSPEPFEPVDIKTCAQKAHENKKLLAFDNSLFGPALVNPFKWGADLVIDVCAGHALISSGHRLEDILPSGSIEGKNPQYEALSIQTLKLRIFEASDNAKIVSSYLYAHPKVHTIHSAWHLNSEYAALAKKYAPQGYAPLVAIELSKSLSVDHIVNECCVFRAEQELALGQMKSQLIKLIQSNRSHVLYRLDQSKLNTSNLLLIVGIEFIDDIIDELECLLK